MDEPEPRSAKDAPHVKKTLEHADDLYDAGSYQECLTTLLDLLENYHMAVLPRMKVLIMLVRYARYRLAVCRGLAYECGRHISLLRPPSQRSL